jgi:hypothetical protein
LDPSDSCRKMRSPIARLKQCRQCKADFHRTMSGQRSNGRALRTSILASINEGVYIFLSSDACICYSLLCSLLTHLVQLPTLCDFDTSTMLGGNPTSNCNITFDTSLIPCLDRPLPYFDLGPVVRTVQFYQLPESSTADASSFLELKSCSHPAT